MSAQALPTEGVWALVRHEYGIDAGRVEGVQRGRRSGSWRERQPALILTNGSTCAHVPIESIQEWRAIAPAGK